MFTCWSLVCLINDHPKFTPKRMPSTYYRIETPKSSLLIGRNIVYLRRYRVCQQSNHPNGHFLNRHQHSSKSKPKTLRTVSSKGTCINLLAKSNLVHHSQLGIDPRMRLLSMAIDFMIVVTKLTILKSCTKRFCLFCLHISRYSLPH